MTTALKSVDSLMSMTMTMFILNKQFSLAILTIFHWMVNNTILSRPAQRDISYSCEVRYQQIIFPFLQDFDAHMRSERHLEKLENMSTLLPQLTDQQLQRMKAEEHIKRIEGKDL